MSSVNLTLDMSPCLKIEEIPAVDMTRDFFIANYFNTRTPVLLKGASSSWEFMQKWTKDYLSTEMGDFQCKVTLDSRPAYAKKQCALRDYFHQYSHLSTMTFEQFNSADESLPRFLQDIPLPNPFFLREDITAYFFFHANIDGGSLPHCHQDAFNLLQQGRKRWVMYDANPNSAPIGWEVLKHCHKEYGEGTHAKDWFVSGPDQVRAQGVTLYDCEQQAGDIMFIPEHFSHAVLNLSENKGMVIITQREGNNYQKEANSGYSPNKVNTK